LTRTAVDTDDSDDDMVTIAEAVRRLLCSETTVRSLRKRIEVNDDGTFSLSELLRVRQGTGELRARIKDLTDPPTGYV
jgi:hypothetical protein